MNIELKAEWKNQADAAALLRIMRLCLQHHGGGTAPLMDFLCSAWSGDDYRPNIYLLCTRVNPEHFDDVLEVMRLIRRTGKETHEFFLNGDVLMRELSRSVKLIKLYGGDEGLVMP